MSMSNNSNERDDFEVISSGLVPCWCHGPVSQHILNCLSPFIFETLSKLVCLFWRRVAATPHLLAPCVRLRIRGNQTSILQVRSKMGLMQYTKCMYEIWKKNCRSSDLLVTDLHEA